VTNIRFSARLFRKVFKNADFLPQSKVLISKVTIQHIHWQYELK
jgi:hypothetical protein